MARLQWSESIRSKVNATYNLHHLLPDDMNFFILLSSLGGIYGSPGQSNYTAGCTFQGALACSRTDVGQRCSVSINLGWMRTIGIIAETEEYRLNQQNAGNMSKIEYSDLLPLLDYYCDPSLPPIRAEHSQVLVGAVTQEHYYTRGEVPTNVLSRPLFAGFGAPYLYSFDGKNGNASQQEDISTLFHQAGTVQGRGNVVMGALKAKPARTMDMTIEEADPRRSLSNYGVDSLMAVEVRNWIRKDLGVSVAVFDIMGSVTLLTVAELVAARAET